MSSSIPRPKKPALERFLSFVAVQEDGCWLWTGCITKGGYGSFRNEHGKTENSHKWAYKVFIGPVPEGLELDHLCRNRACVNPNHLEPVTRSQNTVRGLKGILKPGKISKYVGVYWTERLHKWRSTTKINGKSYYLGHFSSEEEAHQAYVQACKSYEADGTIPVKLLTAKKTSRYPGVSWHKRKEKWGASVRINGKQCYIGYFVSEEEAYQAYVTAKTNFEQYGILPQPRSYARKLQERGGD